MPALSEKMWILSLIPTMIATIAQIVAKLGIPWAI